MSTPDIEIEDGICPTCGGSTANSEPRSSGQCDDCYLEEDAERRYDIEMDRRFEMERERRFLGEDDTP